MAAMTDNTIPLFSFPAVEGKKVTATFYDGRITSDGGVMLLAMAERRLGVAERLGRCIRHHEAAGDRWRECARSWL
jgi:hypothetical protein